MVMVAKKILIVGLRISFLKDDPQITLSGNPTISWALFMGLVKYGFETYLYVDPEAAVDDHIVQKYGSRLIRDAGFFIEQAQADDVAGVVICGTRIQTSLEHQPWLKDLINTRIILAQCYHNVVGHVPQSLIDQTHAAFFAAPQHQKNWDNEYPGKHTGIITTGQNPKVSSKTHPKPEAIFVGHIHNRGLLEIFAHVAKRAPEITFHIVSYSIQDPNGGTYDYINMADYPTIEEKRKVFDKIMADCQLFKPDNLQYHFLMPGDEYALLDRVSLGIDFTWHKDWTIDNSKVSYYLSFGLNVIAHEPAPSHRFIKRFDTGCTLGLMAKPEEWLQAVKENIYLDLATKNKRREIAATLFSWENLAFEIASIFLEREHFFPKISHKQ